MELDPYDLYFISCSLKIWRTATNKNTISGQRVKVSPSLTRVHFVLEDIKPTKGFVPCVAHAHVRPYMS